MWVFVGPDFGRFSSYILYVSLFQRSLIMKRRIVAESPLLSDDGSISGSESSPKRLLVSDEGRRDLIGDGDIFLHFSGNQNIILVEIWQEKHSFSVDIVGEQVEKFVSGRRFRSDSWLCHVRDSSCYYGEGGNANGWEASHYASFLCLRKAGSDIAFQCNTRGLAVLIAMEELNFEIQDFKPLFLKLHFTLYKE